MRTLQCLPFALCAFVASAAAQSDSASSLVGRWGSKSKSDSSGLTYYYDLTLAPDGTFEQWLQGESSKTGRILPRNVDRGRWSIAGGQVVMDYTNRNGQPANVRLTIVEGRALAVDRVGFKFLLLRR